MLGSQSTAKETSAKKKCNSHDRNVLSLKIPRGSGRMLVRDIGLVGSRDRIKVPMIKRNRSIRSYGSPSETGGLERLRA